MSFGKTVLAVICGELIAAIAWAGLSSLENGLNHERHRYSHRRSRGFHSGYGRGNEEEPRARKIGFGAND